MAEIFLWTSHSRKKCLWYNQDSYCQFRQIWFFSLVSLWLELGNKLGSCSVVNQVLAIWCCLLHWLCLASMTDCLVRVGWPPALFSAAQYYGTYALSIFSYLASQQELEWGPIKAIDSSCSSLKKNKISYRDCINEQMRSYAEGVQEQLL